MALSLGSRRVTTPTGTVWRVGRRWLSRDLPKLRRLGADREADAALESAWYLPSDIDIDLDDLGGVIVAIAVAVIVVAVLVPLLIFGFELIIVALLLLASILARTVFGHPWVVLAIPSDGSDTLAWKVTGWQRSGRLIEKVSTELASGVTPLPDDPRTPDQG